MNSNMSLFQKIREIAVLIRIQQLGTSVTAIIGALTVKGMNLGLTNLLVLFFIGVLVNIGGQIHNDIVDVEIDKRSKELKKRPLVSGTVSMKTAKIIIVLCLISVIALLAIFIPNIYAIAILFIGFGSGTLYNLYSKKLPGADLFLSVCMALFIVFGAIAVTDNFEGIKDIGILTWIIAAITFVHVFLMDALGGGLKDLKNDRAAGAKTLAISLGVKANEKLHITNSYRFIILVFEISTVIFALALFFVYNIDYMLPQMAFIILLLFGMVLSTLRLLSIKKFDRKKIKAINRNHELTAYVLVPVILINLIGIYYALFLILLPIIWFVIFNYILYGDSWFNPKTY